LWLGLCALAAARALSALAVECAGECQDLSAVLAKAEESIVRLTKIRATNLEFIAGLDADQDAQRLKATSNVHIAEKRILEAGTRKSETGKAMAAQGCDRCEGS
jgi:hypothetical protein